MLACIGPGWLTAAAPDGSRRLDSPDDWVREEIAIALEAGNHVVPLLLGNHGEVVMPNADEVPEPIRPMVDRQAVWLAPGRGLDATIPVLVDWLAELVPELAERRRSTAQAEAGTTMIQRNDVAGVLLGAAGGSVLVDAGRDAQDRAVRRAGMPIEGELTTLAEAATVALVTAMGTSAWTGVRDAVAGVFRRGGAKGHDQISDRLDKDASLVAAADDKAGERGVLEPFWLRRFSELVQAAPECAHDLAEIAGVRDKAALAGAHIEQHTIVRDSGRAYVALGGNVIAHGDPGALDHDRPGA
jgi:hypothetical protein